MNLIEDINTMQVKVEVGSQGSAIVTNVPIKSVTRPRLRASDAAGYNLEVNLDNSAEITANNVVYVTISPVHNPPSMAPLTGWGIWTGDQLTHRIESGEGGKLQMTEPGDFQTGTKMDVIGSTMVSTENVEYKFTLRTKNDIPQGSKLYFYFPPVLNKLSLDCNDNYVVTADQGIKITDQSR